MNLQGCVKDLKFLFQAGRALATGEVSSFLSAFAAWSDRELL